MAHLSPGFVTGGGFWRGEAARRPAALHPKREPLLEVEPVDALMVDGHAFSAQEPAEGAVTGTRPLRCECT
jgi:hypothetical protein